MKRFKVKYKEKNVDIIIEKGLFNHIENYIDQEKKYFIITDSNVSLYYLNPLKEKIYKSESYIIQSGEKSKNINEARKIFLSLIEKNFSRNDYIIALGGGVVSDLSAFVASIYKRGINLMIIPTSLIGQVDASLGGKTAIDYEEYKNQIGSFYHPNQILVDSNFLETLDKRNKRSGYAEIIKYGFTLNKKIYKALKEDKSIDDLIYLSLKTKAKITAKDEYDNSLRHILNFGHSIAHGIESSSNFSIIHGEAVAIGMVYEISEKYKSELINILKKYDLDYACNISKEELKKYILQDKKINGLTIDKIIIDKIGKSHLEKVKIEDFIGE